MSEAAEVELFGGEPDLTEGAWLRVVPATRARALPDGLVPAVIFSAVVVGTGAATGGLFGVATAEALLIIAALAKTEGPRVLNRVRRGH